jgi:hypothetical protein
MSEHLITLSDSHLLKRKVKNGGSTLTVMQDDSSFCPMTLRHGGLVPLASSPTLSLRAAGGTVNRRDSVQPISRD